MRNQPSLKTTSCKTSPSCFHGNKPMTVDKPFLKTRFFWNLPSHICMKMNPSPLTTFSETFPFKSPWKRTHDPLFRPLNKFSRKRGVPSASYTWTSHHTQSPDRHVGEKKGGQKQLNFFYSPLPFHCFRCPSALAVCLLPDNSISAENLYSVLFCPIKKNCCCC